MSLPLLHVTYTPDSPLYFVCVCNYFNSQLTPAFCVSACRMQGYTLGLWVSVMKPVFVYFILGYRVYRTIIIIKIVTSNTSDSSAVGAGINSMASTRYSNNLWLYTHNKKYSKEFSKKACNSVFVVL